MKHLPYYFIGVAAIQALAGMGFGIYMGISGDYTLAPAHAHNNLLGWVTMAIFGLYYAVAPVVAAKRISAVHFWVALVANVIFPIGIGLAVTNQTTLPSVVGSLLEVLNMLLFAIIVWTNRSALPSLDSRPS